MGWDSHDYIEKESEANWLIEELLAGALANQNVILSPSWICRASIRVLVMRV
jgi:hypothetical protein